MPQNDPNNYNWLTPVIAFVMTIVGGITKIIWDKTTDNTKSTQKVSDSLGAHKLHLAENYVPKDDFKDFGSKMDKRFDRIETLLRSGK